MSQLRQKDIKTNPSIKKAVSSFMQWYSYFQNGAKWRNISSWRNGKVYSDYTVNQEVCDILKD